MNESKRFEQPRGARFIVPLRFIGAAVVFFAAFIFVAQTGFGQSNSESGIAQRHAQHLRHGINLSEWFAQVYDAKGYTKEHFETWNTAQDIALIKAMGFDHVQMILARGLAAIIDVHPESDFKQKLAADDSFVEQFADYWRGLARHYSSTNPDLVSFEILNEPEFHDRYRWQGVQAKLAATIREGAPQHTIIVAGAYWSAESELLFFDPLRDSNIIYNFHFYEPHIFTHQGATWSTNYVHYLKELPYPSTPENVQAAAAMLPDAVNRLQAIHYGLDHWNAARIDGEIGQVAGWAKRWNVPVTCNEFGVYRTTANPQDRAAWISDVRTTLERYSIGWTMWDYSGGFGVVTKKDGRTSPDEVTLKALGLRMPAASH